MCKKILLLFILLFYYVGHSDVGNSYRFYLKIITKKADTLSGYFYHHSWDEYDKYKHLNKSFVDFIQKDSISIYTFINTVNIDDIPIDFSVKSYKKNIQVKDIEDIIIIDYLSFNVRDRIIELTSPEFNLIELSPPKHKTIYNEKVTENCHYILLYWRDDVNKFDLSQDIIEINKKLIQLSKNIHENQNSFFNFLRLKKSELLDKNILLFQECSAL